MILVMACMPLYLRVMSGALIMYRAIKVGTVSIYCYSEGDVATLFGGYKLSGVGGRDNLLQAHHQYTDTKTIWLDLSTESDVEMD